MNLPSVLNVLQLEKAPLHNELMQLVSAKALELEVAYNRIPPERIGRRERIKEKLDILNYYLGNSTKRQNLEFL